MTDAAAMSTLSFHCCTVGAILKSEAGTEATRNPSVPIQLLDRRATSRTPQRALQPLAGLDIDRLP